MPTKSKSYETTPMHLSLLRAIERTIISELERSEVLSSTLNNILFHVFTNAKLFMEHIVTLRTCPCFFPICGCLSLAFCSKLVLIKAWVLSSCISSLVWSSHAVDIVFPGFFFFLLRCIFDRYGFS